MKKCSKCKEEKSLEEFSWKNKSKGKKASEYKECHRKMRKIYYNNNSEKEKTKSYRKETRIK